MLELKKELKKGGYTIKLCNLRDNGENDVDDFFYLDKKNFFINELDKTILLFQSAFSAMDIILEKLDSRTIMLTFYQNRTVITYYYDLINKRMFKAKMRGLANKREKIYYKFIGAKKWRKARIEYDCIKYETHVYYD